MKKYIVAASLLLALLVAPVLVGAQPLPVADPPTPNPNAPTNLGTVGGGIELLKQVLNWISIIFWIVAIIFILYAAFLYLTAAGNEEQVKRATSQLLYAVIAIAVALIATVIPTFVSSFLSTQ